MADCKYTTKLVLVLTIAHVCHLQEYQKNNPNLVVENAEMNNMVYLFKCEGSTLTVKGKINGIIFDSCKKCSVLLDSVVSSVEFVNCQSVQMQVS